MEKRGDDYKPRYRFGTPLPVNFRQGKSNGRVGYIMGSRSDWPKVIWGCDLLEKLEIPFEFGVVSAHRTHKRMNDYAEMAESRSLRAIIAVAGGSSHLQGMSSSAATIPVYGVGVLSSTFGPMDVIGSCVRMPKGVPLAFMGFDRAGSENAALQVARWLAQQDEELHDRLTTFMHEQTAGVPHTCFD